MLEQNKLEEFLSPFDRSKHAKLLDVYIMSLNQHLSTCQNADENKDAEALKNSVHDVKSLGYTLGAQELGETAEKIEACVIENKADEAFTLCPDLYTHIKQVYEVLKQERAKLD